MFFICHSATTVCTQIWISVSIFCGHQNERSGRNYFGIGASDTNDFCICLSERNARSGMTLLCFGITTFLVFVIDCRTDLHITTFDLVVDPAVSVVIIASVVTPGVSTKLDCSDNCCKYRNFNFSVSYHLFCIVVHVAPSIVVHGPYYLYSILTKVSSFYGKIRLKCAVVLFFCAQGGTRTRTGFRLRHFKCRVSTIPPPELGCLRRRPGSNRRITILQIAALTTSPLRQTSLLSVVRPLSRTRPTMSLLTTNFCYFSILSMFCLLISPRSILKSMKGMMPSFECAFT